jgi:hypothetical protein
MIISHRHRFIFIRTPKTASTSLAFALSAVCGERDVIASVGGDEPLRAAAGGRPPQNASPAFHTWRGVREYRARDWARLFLRGRRPYYYDHMSAAEIRRAMGERIWSDYFTFCFERNPFDKVISYYFWRYRDAELAPTLSDFVQSGEANAMSSFDLYAIDGQIAVDRVFRYEDLDAEFARVVARIGVGGVPKLVRTKSHYRTERRPYGDLLSGDDRRWIEGAFAREIRHFGYRF